MNTSVPNTRPTVDATVYLNQSAMFMRGYEPGDTLSQHRWNVPVTIVEPGVDGFGSPAFWLDCAAAVFEFTNTSNFWPGRSVSVGDVIVFGEIALSVESQGFRPVSIS